METWSIVVAQISPSADPGRDEFLAHLLTLDADLRHFIGSAHSNWNDHDLNVGHSRRQYQSCNSGISNLYLEF